jgi:hypothetical protein
MLVHKKVTKEQDTPYCLFLALLALMGGKRKLAQYNQLGSNSRLPKPPIRAALLSAVAGVYGEAIGVYIK